MITFTLSATSVEFKAFFHEHFNLKFTTADLADVTLILRTERSGPLMGSQAPAQWSEPRFQIEPLGSQTVLGLPNAKGRQ